jgi:small subunit ribosomal protein S6
LMVIARCLKTPTEFRTLQQETSVIKNLLKHCATHVLNNKGVVRKFENLGTKQLPYRMKRHQEIFDHGSYSFVN